MTSKVGSLKSDFTTLKTEPRQLQRESELEDQKEEAAGTLSEALCGLY